MRLLDMLHVSASLSVFVAFSGSWYTKLFSVIDHLDLDRLPGVFKSCASEHLLSLHPSINSRCSMNHSVLENLSWYQWWNCTYTIVTQLWLKKSWWMKTSLLLLWKKELPYVCIYLSLITLVTRLVYWRRERIEKYWFRDNIFTLKNKKVSNHSWFLIMHFLTRVFLMFQFTWLFDTVFKKSHWGNHNLLKRQEMTSHLTKNNPQYSRTSI